MASPTELAREAMEHSRAIRNEFDLLTQLVQFSDLPGLRDRLMSLNSRIDVLETRLAELERCKQEADKRQWQFVYITLGVIGSLLCNVVVQLLLWALRK